MNFLVSVANFIDGINNALGKFVNWITALLVAVVFADVVMRYLFNISFVFTQELEWHLFAFIFLMGAGYTLITDGHVRVDIFYQRLSPKGRAWINLIGCILCLFPGCLLIITTSLPFVESSFSIMEGSPDPGGIPFRYVLKACIPVGFVFFGLQGVALFIRSLLTLLGREDQAPERGVH